jgi:hypothetical protein
MSTILTILGISIIALSVVRFLLFCIKARKENQDDE